jgi:serine/threonine-protein kinase
MSPRLSSETGRVLGGRYRLVAPVGVGTSSRVFLAVDTQLRRRVAVKLLHEALAEDQAFLRRFRAEARAAGALSHPNILAVFDWGEDRTDEGVVPYLVTEYLGGGSLRDILDRGRPLTPSQTLVVGLDATRALAHAHQRGLVHRDVKPANLLFDEDGRLRLADFGLARALAEASWTEPSGIAVGTARYASPEQALGRRLDGRSDVYSLALVLVECVTGSVPFSGETTAATLTLRTQGDLELGPELGGLRSVLERAGRLDPDERPEAAEFEIALMAAAEELDRPEPLPIVPTLGDGEQTSEMHLVAGLGGVSLLDGELDAELGGADERLRVSDPRVIESPPPRVIEPGEPVLATQPLDPSWSTRADSGSTAPAVDDGVADGRNVDGVAAGTSTGLHDPAESPERRAEPTPAEPIASAATRSPITVAEEHDLLAASRPSSFGRVDPLVAASAPAPRRSRRARRSLLVLLVIALVVAAGTAWWLLVRVPVHDVPDFVGQDIAAVTARADELGWRVDASTEDRRDGTEPGEVLAQAPSAGQTLPEGDVLRLTVSLGPTLAPVPQLPGAPLDQATTAIEQAGFVVGAVTRAVDEEVPADAVVSAAPADASVQVDSQGRLPKGTPIDLVVSSGPAPRVVPPGLQGARVEDAAAALEAVQLVARRNESFSEVVPEGFVISVSQAPGTELARGTDVVLEVSKGPAPITVPDVRFNSGSVATALLEDAGFTVSGIEGSPSGMVLATDPPAGEQHPRGTAVRIFTRS